MKKAFLLAALLMATPCLAAGSGPVQPAVKEGAIQDLQPSSPSPDSAPAAPVIRKKIRHPGLEATASAPKERIVAVYGNQAPTEWGEKVTGIRTRLDTSEKVIALTFDACGGPKGNRYDAALIDYLRKEKVSATLFMSGVWIDANPAVFMKLAADPLFEIANHGLTHRPCSVNGNTVYGIQGTSSVAELVDEIEENGKKLEAATGSRPKFYRPGTDWCDDVGVKVANALGYEVVNYSVLGDAGATRKKKDVKDALLKAEPGAIVILHMNQPRSETAAGLREAIPLFRKKGYRFVKLSEYPLK